VTNDYTPTAEQIREYIEAADRVVSSFAPGDAATAFERWLAAHDAEKRAEWEAEYDDQRDTIVKLSDQIEEARTAWWSAVTQGDNGLIYTDRIEDAMDDIWSAIGDAEWVPVNENEGTDRENGSAS
jgi:hypothetical protein